MDIKKYDLEKILPQGAKGEFYDEKNLRKKGARRDAKLCDTIEDAIKKSPLKNGDTISFHHGFRGGDKVINQVVPILAKMGFKGLTIASSSLTTTHDEIIEHIKTGVITQIYSSGLRGELGKFVSEGKMMDLHGTTVQIHSHGGRVNLIDRGELNIDVAFLGAPVSDKFGNATGSRGKSKCGSMGYAMADAAHAKHVIILTEEIVEFPNKPASIRQDQVDSVVVVGEVGDPTKIGTGETRLTTNPKELMIANQATNLIVNSGVFKEGFSLQTGSGGSSLATTVYLGEEMKKQGITASFGLGGITGTMVKMHEEGLIKKLIDVQSFDMIAGESIGKNEGHAEISANEYANFSSKGATIANLDVVILSALEIDTNFNVNVITGSNGVLRGASGGHSDTAADAKLAIIVAPLTRGRIPTIVKKVNTIVTPGASVDAVVTDQGIAINPANKELKKNLQNAGIKTIDIKELQQKAYDLCGEPETLEFGERPVAAIRYRDGSVIDVVREMKK